MESQLTLLSMWGVLCAVLLSAATLYYCIYKYCVAPYRVLKTCGIKGPLPLPIIGNYLIFKMHLSELCNYLYYRYQGPAVGLYFGTTLTIYVKDPEMIKQITITQFDCFRDRPSKAGIVPHEYKTGGLASSTGEVWRDTRKILTPAFSMSKMKLMIPSIKESVDVLVERFRNVANSEQSINVLEFYGRFTLESILLAAFGRRVDVQKAGKCDLLTAVLNATKINRDRVISQCMLLLKVVPCLESCVHFLLPRKYSAPWTTMQEVTKKLIETRKAVYMTTKPQEDILQLMIKASDDTSADTEITSMKRCPTLHHNGSKKHKLSTRELLDNSLTLLTDETSRNTLAYATYLLAINPLIQMRLQSDIDKFYMENPDVTLYEATQGIPYLDYTIQETLRLFPPSLTISRLCVKSTAIGGVYIPEGAQVHIPIKELHYDPTYWRNPEKFDPNRFSPQEKCKRPNNVHLPFGDGQRNCIGKRFALMEAKIVLLELLKVFSFVQGPHTKSPVSHGFSMTPTEGIFVKVILRNKCQL